MNELVIQLDRKALVLWSMIALVVFGSGVVYSRLVYGGSYLGGLYALAVCMPIIAFERGLFMRGLRASIMTLPTWAYILGELFVYLSIMTIAFLVTGTALWFAGLTPGRLVDAAVPSLQATSYRLLLCLAVIATLRFSDLLGRQKFINLLLGRYRRPISEERIFLFVDLVGSTAYAERFGDLKTMSLLSSIFTAIADPIRDNAGTVDDYIGDGVMISWQMDKGLRHARCIQCALGIFEVVKRNSEPWQTEFGHRPQIRAALHGGPVIVAEVGSDHHKITYFGDTVNTAARLEGLCKTLNRELLISAALARQMDLPPNVVVDDLGVHTVKGRRQPIDIRALTCLT